MTDFTNGANDSLISEEQFHEYTFAWEKLVNENAAHLDGANSQSLNPYFLISKAPNVWTTGIYFTEQAIHRLISSVGVITVQARFAIMPKQGDNAAKSSLFTIILYGTDTLGARSSAFYIGQPISEYMDCENALLGGQIAYPLAQSWICNWQKLLKTELGETVEEAGKGIKDLLFSTKYGYLKGYSYDMMDFTNTIYTLNTDNTYDLLVMLALHDHHYVEWPKNAEVKYTFGLVLKGVTGTPPTDGNGKATFTITDDSFYDLSAPCPPTCFGGG